MPRQRFCLRVYLNKPVCAPSACGEPAKQGVWLEGCAISQPFELLIPTAAMNIWVVCKGEKVQTKGKGKDAKVLGAQTPHRGYVGWVLAAPGREQSPTRGLPLRGQQDTSVGSHKPRGGHLATGLSLISSSRLAAAIRCVFLERCRTLIQNLLRQSSLQPVQRLNYPHGGKCDSISESATGSCVTSAHWGGDPFTAIFPFPTEYLDPNAAAPDVVFGAVPNRRSSCRCPSLALPAFWLPRCSPISRVPALGGLQKCWVLGLGAETEQDQAQV